ncbi:hypothetical protein AB0H88_50490 [Nonomuraea sp. NPDC050680]|uniref:hypothetical protein n=1 Tax=Nonomuraea sp. NPDC050680 TaxID=3154630 RepID=UPI0033CE2E7F
MSTIETPESQQHLAEPPVIEEPGRRRWVTAGIGSAVALVALAAAGYGIFQTVSAKPAQPYGGTPPWSIPDDPAPGMKAAGLTAGPMGTAEHYHAHLSVFVDGRAVEVPANIGIEGEDMTPVHTHDARGVIHVESRAKGEVYTLGQIFKQWGVTLSANQIGALRTGNGKVLTTQVDGKPFTGDPAAIVIKAHEQISLVYGVPDPSFTPPTSFAFKADE